MANQGISMPSESGGLMHYNEEYKSIFKIRPAHVILFIVLIIAFVAILKVFWPVAS